ncbi:MAG: transposase [Acetobacteraceae bacterium]|nr:transposase [Acetobacteraceae bacterium]
MERVEIITCGEGRRIYSPGEKARLLAEAAEPGARVLEVAQRHGVSPSLLHRWRREAEGRPARKMARRAAQPASFVPLLLATANPATPPVTGPAASEAADVPIEVVLRNGRMLRVGAGADAAAVARLAAALEA